VGPTLVAGLLNSVAIANELAVGIVRVGMVRRPGRVVALSQRILTGMIGINGGLRHSPDMPSGGYMQADVEREMGVTGFEHYRQIKSPAETA